MTWIELGWPQINSPLNFNIWPQNDLWPWLTSTPTPYNHRGPRPISGATLSKVGSRVTEIWVWPRNDLDWPRITSDQLSFKFQYLTQNNDLWPWLTLTPTPTPLWPSGGGARAISGATLVKIGAGVLQRLTHIQTHIHPENYSKMLSTFISTNYQLCQCQGEMYTCRLVYTQKAQLWTIMNSDHIRRIRMFKVVREHNYKFTFLLNIEN